MTNVVVGLVRSRPVAVGLIVAGQLAAVVGLIGIVSAPDERAEIAVVTTTTTSTSTRTSSSSTSTATTSPSTTSTSTTTTTTTTTSRVESTSTTEPVAVLETLDAFVAEFNRTNTSGDTAFALERLHPVVIDIFTSERCKEWLDARFSSTTIEIVGAPTEPTTKTIDAPDGPTEVPDYFTAEALLTFQGSVSETVASFAYVDGAVHWFTNCEAS